MPPELSISTHASESGHWYTRLGAEAHSVRAKAGHMRPTTLLDARKLLLVPSVTTILKCAAAPGLENWKVDQGILAALTLPRREGEHEADWLVRVKQDSKEQARAAAERGTAIHAAIEGWYGGYVGKMLEGELVDMIDAVHGAILNQFGGDVEWVAERTFADNMGFGGKADLLGYEYLDGPDEPPSRSILIDFKSKDVVDDTTKGYDEQAMQLAAYRYGLGAFDAVCANVFVTRQSPWAVQVHTWSDNDIERGWRMFQGLMAYWQAKNNFDPSWRDDCDDIDF